MTNHAVKLLLQRCLELIDNVEGIPEGCEGHPEGRPEGLAELRTIRLLIKEAVVLMSQCVGGDPRGLGVAPRVSPRGEGANPQHPRKRFLCKHCGIAVSRKTHLARHYRTCKKIDHPHVQPSAKSEVLPTARAVPTSDRVAVSGLGATTTATPASRPPTDYFADIF